MYNLRTPLPVDSHNSTFGCGVCSFQLVDVFSPLDMKSKQHYILALPQNNIRVYVILIPQMLCWHQEEIPSEEMYRNA